MKGLKVKDMAWLDAANGWIHFAVGGEDCYYTDALCRLTLRQRLEWSLREHGYREVWRIESKREAWEIRSKSESYFVMMFTKDLTLSMESRRI